MISQRVQRSAYLITVILYGYNSYYMFYINILYKSSMPQLAEQVVVVLASTALVIRVRERKNVLFCQRHNLPLCSLAHSSVGISEDFELHITSKRSDREKLNYLIYQIRKFRIVKFEGDLLKGIPIFSVRVNLSVSIGTKNLISCVKV